MVRRSFFVKASFKIDASVTICFNLAMVFAQRLAWLPHTLDAMGSTPSPDGYSLKDPDDMNFYYLYNEWPVG